MPILKIQIYIFGFAYLCKIYLVFEYLALHICAYFVFVYFSIFELVLHYAVLCKYSKDMHKICQKYF